ncbi:hypothetical protein QBC38DRAFT_102147 [Podospora fimiseda]|uniref:N-acetyltransferase ESCO zinc-finger domain-containing protein n=1 Tax=Podospora fimiseda TaxID=252190 RepID=A0AAN6YMR7_9PEZI|nr:hypothetical protein QBC38DRAFT_102147 [Podospora fimiseda]
MSINQPSRSTSPVQSQLIEHTSSPPRPRKRPLRTYGRQSASAKARSQPQPISKKRKVQQDENVTPPPNAEELPQLPKPAEVAPPQKPQAKRTSILAYFKPRPVPPSSDSPSISDDIPIERPPSPPPSSPPRRTRRRLTTKPSLPLATENELEHDETTTVAKGVDELLGEVPINTTYTTEETENGNNKRTRSRTPGKELVQTVLNLTVNKEAGFLVCNDCGILYNPLNGEDRKEHGRRHRAWMREKRKEGERSSIGE